MEDYVSSLPRDLNFKEKNRIAVVYAIGDITSGEGDDQTIGSDRIAAAIRTARLDKEVKAIVETDKHGVKRIKEVKQD